MERARVEGGHGDQGKEGGEFTRLKELRTQGYDLHKLAILADAMRAEADEANDGPDAEENLYVPAGYTYLGQFVDHDLTFDATSTLGPQTLQEPTNLRSPRFDLDCLYGAGPADRPFMYDADGVTLLYGGRGPDTPLNTPWDLLRSVNGRAIIGDKRNDENSIVNQIQMLFLRFHNKVAEELKVTRRLNGADLFKAARDEVRWAYQRILVDDFLPRIIASSVLQPFVEKWLTQRASAYLWYTDEGGRRGNLPREFVAAAYRFGHSGIRNGYRLNGQPGPHNGFAHNVFDHSNDPKQSLVGFDPLPESHVIDDWSRFFPKDQPRPGTGFPTNEGTPSPFKDGGEGKVRLQYAYKLDTTLVEPLTALPTVIANPGDVPAGVGSEYRAPARPFASLAQLNLLRGSVYRIQGGQAFAADLGECLPPEAICVRRPTQAGFTFTRVADLEDGEGNAIGPDFDHDTPLWFYILAEAQRPLFELWRKKGADLTEDDLLGKGGDTAPDAGRPNPGAGTQLGPVGGRIVAEVFYGLLDSDPESFVNAAPATWSPIWGGTGPATVARLIEYAHGEQSE